jgi:hypothetical protein
MGPIALVGSATAAITPLHRLAGRLLMIRTEDESNQGT